jgi:hypothetical protein
LRFAFALDRNQEFIWFTIAVGGLVGKGREPQLFISCHFQHKLFANFKPLFALPLFLCSANQLVTFLA